MGKTVLLVEDDNLVRQTLARALQAKGVAVVEAVNGKEGLKKVLATPVNLVVTDVRMPEMDGLQMVEELRKNPKGKDKPVIILSNDDQTLSLNQALKAGVTTYLSKSSLDAESIADQIVVALG